MFEKPIRALVATLLLCGAPTLARAEALELPPDLSGDPEAQGFADLLFANGMANLAVKRYEEALPFFEKAAATWPKDATYAYFAAICKLRLGALERATPGGTLTQDLGGVIASLLKSLPPAPNRVPEARVRYDLGEAHYLRGNHGGGDLPDAERELRVSIRLDPRDAWAHFYLGLVVFDEGRAEEAFGEFERAISLDSSLTAGGSYYLGVGAYKRGDPEAARGYFEKVLTGAPGPEVRTSTEKWLAALVPTAAPTSPPKGEIRVSLAVEHDDNPAQLNEVVTISRIESDRRAALQIRGGWQPLTAKGGWTLGLVFNGYGSRHDDFPELDLDGIQGVFQAAWGADPLGYVNGPLGYARTGTGADRIGLLFQVGSSYFDRDGDSFRRDHEASASLLFREPGFGKTQLDLHYDDETYFTPKDQVVNGDPNPFRFSEFLTGHTSTVSLGQYFQLGGRPDRFLRVALSRARKTAQTEALERDTDQALLELALPLAPRWTVFAYGSRSKDDYRDETVFQKADRTDLAGTLVLGISRYLYATARYAWTKRDVTPDTTSFERKIASAGLTWHW